MSRDDFRWLIFKCRFRELRGSFGKKERFLRNVNRQRANNGWNDTIHFGNQYQFYWFVGSLSLYFGSRVWLLFHRQIYLRMSFFSLSTYALPIQSPYYQTGCRLLSKNRRYLTVVTTYFNFLLALGILLVCRGFCSANDGIASVIYE